MKKIDEDTYREYVVARMDRLRRTAYLMCHNWHTADDLVSVTIDKLYRHWRRANGATNLDAYVHKILINSWLDERRKPWRREVLTEQPPSDSYEHSPVIDDQRPLMALLRTLTPRRRAAVVLRYYCDLSVGATAEVLGCSEGTVKSLTARGLDNLREQIVTGTRGS